MSAAGSTDAIKERERLTIEFAELQALDRALETLGASVRSVEAAGSEELREVHREAAAKAFADYDLNKNGVIELNELAYLTAELGYPMDAKELQSALKAINTSGNGKISFDEFSVWWNGTATPASQRDGLALALLRARLWIHKGEKLIGQIGKRRGVHFPDAKAWDKSDAKTHSYSLSVGEFGEAKAGLHYRFHHNLILDADIVNSDPKYTVFYSFDLKHTGKADFPAYLRETFRSIADVSKGAIVTSVSQPKKDVVRLTVGFALPIPVDPATFLEQYGFNLEQLSRSLRLDFEFGTSVAEVFGQQKYALADIIKARVKAHVHLENSMLANVMNSLVATAATQRNNGDLRDLIGTLPFVMGTESSLTITTGEVAEVVSGLAEYTRATFGEQSQKMKDVKIFTAPIQEKIAGLIKKEAARDRRKELPIVISAVRAAALTFQRDVVEFLQLGAWTRSGVGGTAECDRLIRMDDALVALDFVERTVFEAYDQIAKEGGGGPGTGSGSGAAPRKRF